MFAILFSVCQGNEFLDENGDCKCLGNQVKDANGNCVCPPGQNHDGSGNFNCVCPDGTTEFFSPDGSNRICQPPVGK